MENQRKEITHSAEKNGVSIDKWYTEIVSGSINSEERKLSGLLGKMYPSDSLIVTEISRLNRTLLEIMTILNSYIKKEVTLYSTKEGYVFQNDINSKMLGFVSGLMAEVECNLILMQTRETLIHRKQEEKRPGWKRGYTSKMRILAKGRKELAKKRRRGTSCSKFVRQVGGSRTTMFRFLHHKR